MIVRNARQILEWIGSHGTAVLIALLIVVGGTWAFIELADEVIDGDTQRFDEWAVRAMRNPNDLSDPLGPRWLEEAGRDLTGLGGVIVLSLFTAGVAGYFFLARMHRTAWFVIIAVVGGQLLSSSLKYSFSRPRPDVVEHLSHVYTSSFPSGHSMLSAVVYLTLGSLMMRFTPRRSLKFYSLAIALTLTVLVGISRVYLGVHYPTDVLAGWTAGLVWALLCWLVAGAMQRRGRIDESAHGDSRIQSID